MIKCVDCNKFLACEKASEDITECLDFKKQTYMKLVKAEGEIKIFERIDE